MDPNRQPGLKIAQIFLESAVFSHRKDFLKFAPSTPINMEIQISLTSGISPDKRRGRVQLQAQSSPDGEGLYSFSVAMTALVEPEGEENLEVERYVTINGGGLLFPFLREAVANLTARGRFGPVWLAPINLLAQTSGENKVRTSTKPSLTPARAKERQKRKAAGAARRRAP